MRKLPPLPPHLLARPFTIADARAAGVDVGLLRTRLLDRPFHGVRSVNLDLTRLQNRARAYAARIPHDGVFSHSTAARLWQLPLPIGLPQELHVTVPIGSRAPQVKGVVGHQQRLAQLERGSRSGLSVASPAATWAQLAQQVSLEDLIAAGEYILTGNAFDGIPPLGTVADLHAATTIRAGGPGHRNRVRAFDEMRPGPLSRPETLVRVLATRCGVPHPLINYEVYDDLGRFIAMPDLAWLEYKVALEYEGDYHREIGRFRRDIRRVELLIDHDWLVIRISADDLFDRPDEVVRRIERRLRSRGWTGSIDLRRLTRFVR